MWFCLNGTKFLIQSLVMKNIKIMDIASRSAVSFLLSRSPQIQKHTVRCFYINYINYHETVVFHKGFQGNGHTSLTYCQRNTDYLLQFPNCIKRLVIIPIKNNLNGSFHTDTTKSDKMNTAINERPVHNINHNSKDCIEASDLDTKAIIEDNVAIYPEFITEEEEKSLFNEVEPYLKRLHYEYDHWDDAIEGYRETERKHWSAKNKVILQRHRDIAFEPGTPQLPHVHVLDLAKSGCVKAHIDSVRFCGNTISGICLLSPSVMRFVHDKDKTKYANVLLNRRTLYAMKGRARYEYTHEILRESESRFRGEVVPRDRRIVIICRNAPTDNYENTGS